MPTPTMMKVKAGELAVCDLVQRQVEEAHCKRMAKNWDDSLVGVLSVSHRDGKLYLIDGQQRFTVKTQFHGDLDYEFDVVMYEGLTVKDEGRMFLSFNRDHKAVSAYDKYKVAVTIGEPDETAVSKIVKAAGFKVSARSSERTIGCVSTLLRIHKQFGDDILKQTIEMTARLYGQTDDPWNATFMEGLAIFINRYGNQPYYDFGSIYAALAKVPVAQLVQEARMGNSNNRAVGQMAEAIFSRYNARRRNKLEWKSPHAS